MKPIKKFLKKILLKLSPEIYLKIIYKKTTGEKLNIKKPTTFNEKIQWLKLYDYPKNELIIECADKLKMHDYLKRKGLSHYSVNILGSWDNFQDISWNNLPNKFVLKMNHGSGFNIFVEDIKKTNLQHIEYQIENWKKTDFGLVSLERHYSKIQPIIMIEEFLDLAEDLLEFQFFCFNGTIKFCRVIRFDNKITKELKATCYSPTPEWRKMNITYIEGDLPEKIPVPDNLQAMLDTCAIISEDFHFVRIDFLKLKNGGVLLNELTFSPTSGLATVYTPEAQKKIGDWLVLDLDNRK